MATDGRSAGGSASSFLEHLHSIALTLSRAATLEQVTQAILTHIVAALRARAGSVALLAADGAALEVTASDGYPVPPEGGWPVIPLSSPRPMAEAVRERGPVWLSSLEEWRDRYPEISHPLVLPGAAAALPMIVDDRVLGVIGLSFGDTREFADDERNFMRIVAEQCAQAVDWARLFDSLRSELEGRRRVESALAAGERSAEAAQRQSAEQLQAILRAVADGITVQSGTGFLVYANEAAARMIGYSSVEALLQAPLDEVRDNWDMEDEDGAPFPAEQLPGRRALSGEAEPSALLRYRNRKSGEERWSMVRAVPVYGDDGTVKLAVSASHDVTDLHRAIDDANAALATRQRFISIASHELRTPLTALKGHLQLVRRRLQRGADPQALAASVISADRQVDRLNRLVGELLDVSRLAEGRFAVRLEPIDLSGLIVRIVEQEREVTPDRPIECEVGVLPALLHTDPFRLEQVLTNLISNARKYSPSVMPICVEAEMVEKRVNISVRDYGIGVPSDEREQIFEPFHRAVNVDRSVSGLGLGLYVAREIVRLHGGTLTVDAAPGGGSVFTISLPAT